MDYDFPRNLHWRFDESNLEVFTFNTIKQLLVLFGITDRKAYIF